MVEDPRDQALYNTCPLVAAPKYSPFQPLPEAGQRFVAAQDGFYLEARSSALHALIRLSTLARPQPTYGKVEEFIDLANGPIPRHLFQQFVHQACMTPNEIAAIIQPEEAGYSLATPAVISAGPGHIQYSDVEFDNIVVDMHSHGLLPAYFSQTDDASDLSRMGPYIAVVVGTCRDNDSATWVARFVCGNHLLTLDVGGPLMQAVLA